MYADDLVLVAKEKRGMKLMIEEFRRYVWEKGLEVNLEKSKMVRFGKRAGIKGKGEWKWGENEIEEVNEFNYLDFIFQRKGR